MDWGDLGEYLLASGEQATPGAGGVEPGGDAAIVFDSDRNVVLLKLWQRASHVALTKKQIAFASSAAVFSAAKNKSRLRSFSYILFAQGNLPRL